MQKILIVTDTCCDLNKEQIAELGIKALPLTITMGDIVFKETYDKSTYEFYDLMIQDGGIPKTSAVSPNQFGEAFAEAYRDGYTHVICVTLNSLGSATFNNSVIAKNEFFEENPEAADKMTIYNLDSKCYTSLYGYPITEAVKKINKGMPAEDIVAYFNEWFERAAVYVVPYTLKYAKKSGRVSAAAAFAGELLGLKPIIEFADGTTTTLEKIRGEKNIIPKLLACLDKNMTPQTPYVIIHGRDDSLARELEKEMVKKFGRKAEMFTPIGAIVSSHIGPDLIAVLCKRKNIE